MNQQGKKAIACLREPSLGPCFGMKGGGTGGGYAQVVPMEDINLHFTGDIHAVSAAHNLLSAMVDNELHWRPGQRLDPRRVTWGRVVDMNDRALRHMVVGIGGPAHGMPRQSRFDISVASEVMAILCLAEDMADLRRRLGDIVVGAGSDGSLVTAADLQAQGAMAALLKDAMLPNLVQSLEHNPVLVHGGPFANIAHGCSSLLATRTALGLADYVVTEAGFGADLGAQKFLDIKCVAGGLKPAASVMVATVRALKYHGGVDVSDLGKENLVALESGFANLQRHLENMAKYGVPAVVAINRFTADTEQEIQRVVSLCQSVGINAIVSDHWASGGTGALDLADALGTLLEHDTAQFKPLVQPEKSLWEKTEQVATQLYGAVGISADKKALDKYRQYQHDYGHFPICMAKTPASFSTDPAMRGAPEGHMLNVRDLRLSAGAGFVVAICGDVLTMPGLPKEPNAIAVDVNADGMVTGLA
jgi:formate--tetrahydrofolate ligase